MTHWKIRVYLTNKKKITQFQPNLKSDILLQMASKYLSNEITTAEKSQATYVYPKSSLINIMFISLLPLVNV